MHLYGLIKHIRRVLLLVLILSLFFSSSDLTAADFRIENHYIKNNNGHFKLEWDASKGAVVEVQQSRSKEFHNATLLYKGTDRASFISGLENGKHYYRVKENGAWSPTLVINVQHQSLQLAFTLFTLGAVVFLLTLLVVLKGMKQVNTI